MIQSNLSTYYYIEEGDQHPFSGRQLLYSPARRSLNLKRGESPDTPRTPLDDAPACPPANNRQSNLGSASFMFASRDTGVWVSVSSSADNVVASNGSIQPESRW